MQLVKKDSSALTLPLSFFSSDGICQKINLEISGLEVESHRSVVLC